MKQFPTDLSVEDFDFELSDECIASQPLEDRVQSKLLVVAKDSGHCSDHVFTQLKDFLRAGDLLIINDTKVFPARLFGNKETGGKVEILAERILDNGLVKVQLKASKSPKPGTKILLQDNVSAEVIDREDEFFIIKFDQDLHPLEYFERYGHTPLPPYISRQANQVDVERYQTVFAKQVGAVAAPTAGLHFSAELLDELTASGVVVNSITLHVGAGTFKPVQVEQVMQHKMHSEYAVVSEQVCQQIQTTKQAGGRVVAVGTTCVRALESAALSGGLQPFLGETDIFIYPGFKFNVIDALITNFHLPRSTLLMLVTAFAGHTNTMQAYQHAIQHKYRFYSYGDAMLIIN